MLNNNISNLFDKLPFSKDFVLQKAKECNNALELSSMFDISISQSNQLLKYCKIYFQKQTTLK